MDWSYYLIILIIGIFTGIASGMFGIGGAAVSTPLLNTFTLMNPLIAFATPIFTVIPTSISGMLTYHKKKLIHKRIALYTLLTAMPVSLLGTWLTNFFHSEFLLIAKAVLLLILGLNVILSKYITKNKSSEPVDNIYANLLTGVLGGLVSGFLAVGGGIIFVNLFLRINNLEMKQAVGTSLVCVAATSVVSLIGQIILGNIDFVVGIVLTLTTVPFASIGAKMAVKMKNETLEFSFGLLIISFALFFIFNNLI